MQVECWQSSTQRTTWSALAVEFDQGRYSRHKLLEWFDQQQISSTRALVVGAGAIGNEVLKNLALLGVGHLDICDLDTIEVHNLTRSVLFRESDVGQSKAAVAARAVQDLLPEARVRAMHGDLGRMFVPSDLKSYTVVFSCLDNFEARLQLDALCFLAGVDVVSGAIDARYASVEIYPYRASRKTACYSCNLPLGAYQRVAERYSCGWLRRIGHVERKVPTTAITSSVAGALMVSWGLRLGAATTFKGSQRLLHDTFTGEARSSELQKNSQCPSCSLIHSEVISLSWDEPLNFPSEFHSGAVEASSPTEVVFTAVCQSCHLDVKPQVKPGSRVRDYSTDARLCPSCGSESVVIDAREHATLREFSELCSGRAPDIPYLLTHINGNTFCLEVRHERANTRDHPNGGPHAQGAG
jgi:molybdopterin-synthase adenylyltransferase